MRPIALTIAGSDPSGGAGLQADLKTFHQFGVYGEAVVTLITVQNTVRVSQVEVLDADLVGRQLDAVLEDIPPGAVKTGALGGAAVIEAVAARKFPGPLVVDPVMVSKHGAPLIDEGARSALRNSLLPKAFLVTPNLQEAAELAGIEVTSPEAMREAARRIAGFGPGAVLIKGGHLPGDALDILYYDGEFTEFRSPRTNTVHTHGTGCTYSAAIAACLSRGDSLQQAVTTAKAFITAAIRSSPGFGAGSGPVNHFS
jgi:hydroxymethylpyrimidine/phosphomethylpyrimidine kinase